MRWFIFAFALLVPASASSAGSRLSTPFKVSKVEVRDGKLKYGRWQLSQKVSSKKPMTIAVVAPWCGACRRTLETMRAKGIVSRIDLIAIPLFEVFRAKPEQFEQYRGLDVHVMQNDAAADVAGYPSFFTCAPKGACRELDRAERERLVSAGVERRGSVR